MSGLVARAREDRAQLGIVMMLVAYMFFAAIDTSVKWLVIAGLHAFQLAFMRYVGHFLCSLALMAYGGLSWDRFATGQIGLVLLRAMFLISSSVFNFVSLTYLPLTVTSAIMFSAPIIVCALSYPLLGERVGPWRWIAIVIGFVGVLVVIRPFGETFHWAALLSAYNALAMALYSIITRKLSGEIAAETMQFYMGAIGTAVLLPLAWMTWQNPTTALDWGLLIGLGVWGWAGHGLMTRAHGFATASTLMPYTYSFMVYLTITSYLVFADLPDRLTLVGAGIIVASGLVIWWRETKGKTRG
ncbi:MAG: DMT family transporter [Sedimentitalea sp.]